MGSHRIETAVPAATQVMELNLRPEEVEDLVQAVDRDGSGSIDLAEVCGAWQGGCERAAARRILTLDTPPSQRGHEEA